MIKEVVLKAPLVIGKLPKAVYPTLIKVVLPKLTAEQLAKIIDTGWLA